MGKDDDDPIVGLLKEAQEASRAAQAAAEDSKKALADLLARDTPPPATAPAMGSYEDLVSRVTDGVGERLLKVLEERGALPDEPPPPAPTPPAEPPAPEPPASRVSWRERILGT